MSVFNPYTNVLDNMSIAEGEFPGCNGRNEGLIGITEDATKNTRSWEEGRITIDIKNKAFRFNCATEKDYKEYEDIWERVKDLFYNIEGFEDINCWELPFDKIDLLYNGIKQAQENFRGRFVLGYRCLVSIY